MAGGGIPAGGRRVNLVRREALRPQGLCCLVSGLAAPHLKHHHPKGGFVRVREWRLRRELWVGSLDTGARHSEPARPSPVPGR